MTKRRDLEHHRDSLEEIGEILSSMKTLAYMETRKLSRFLAAQQNVVDSISGVAADFLDYYPGLPAELQNATPVYLVVGSERGFCGDFNRVVARRLSDAVADNEHDGARVISVGHKMRSVLEGDETVAAFLDGASVVEEIPAVMRSLIDTLNSLQISDATMTLIGIHHEDEAVSLTPLLPPVLEGPMDGPRHPFPPLLNVSPEQFLADLLDHYLFAALTWMLYTSLMSENQRRVSHLEGAVRHIEEESAELTRKCRALRQEEIVEEIEVILLSTAHLDGGGEAIEED
jgi:F-type H+-transporting ATPase subunit gamma